MASASKVLLVKAASQSSSDGIPPAIEIQNRNRALQAIFASASHIAVYDDNAHWPWNEPASREGAPGEGQVNLGLSGVG
jgi:hypothetical protein